MGIIKNIFLYNKDVTPNKKWIRVCGGVRLYYMRL